MPVELHDPQGIPAPTCTARWPSPPAPAPSTWPGRSAARPTAAPVGTGRHGHQVEQDYLNVADRARRGRRHVRRRRPADPLRRGLVTDKLAGLGEGVARVAERLAWTRPSRSR